MTEQQCLKALCRIQCGAKRSKKCEDCECFDDKVNIWKCVENTQESLVLRQLIREHFELVELLKPHGYGMLSADEFERWINFICKHNADNDMIIMFLNEQLESIKNPQPYKFEDLRTGMFVFDCIKNRVNKIIEIFEADVGIPYIKFDDGFGEWFIIEFEENRFFSLTKELEYQE